MKKRVSVGFLVFFIIACCLMAAALATSVLSGEGEDGYLVDMAADNAENDQIGSEVQVLDTPSQGGRADQNAPDVRWTYPVRLTALYSPFNILVNRDNKVDEKYGSDDSAKTRASIKRASSAAIYMNRTAEIALAEMFETALEEGIRLFLKSGHRSYGTQKTIYENRMKSEGKDDGVVAPAGASEHQTGLACDILNQDYAGRPRMTPDFSQTKEAQWMKEYCADFGFILRYPEDKQEITKTIFEPWHFRYVGREVASYVMRTEMSFEEFWVEWQAEVDAFKARGGDVEAWMKHEADRINRESEPESHPLDEYGNDGDQEISLVF